MLLELVLMIFAKIVFETLPWEKLHLRDCSLKKPQNPTKLKQKLKLKTKTNTKSSTFPKLQKNIGMH